MTLNLRARLVALCAALAATLSLSACAPLLVGGAAATTALVVTDRRTTGEQVEDQAIEFKIRAEMQRLFENRANVSVTSYAGQVLLVGSVPDEAARQQAAEAAGNVEKVVKVVNQLNTEALPSLSSRSHDAWLTSKVKTNLVRTKQVPSRTIVITTERSVVYLLGKLTAQEAERAAIVAASVGGVARVVKLFEIIPEEGQAPAPQAPAASSAPDSDGQGAQAFPVQ